MKPNRAGREGNSFEDWCLPDVEAHIGEEGGIVSEDEGRPFGEQHRTLRYLWYHYDITRSTRVMHRNF